MGAPSETTTLPPETPGGGPSRRSGPRRKRSWQFITNVLVLTLLILVSSEIIDACRGETARRIGSDGATIGDIAPGATRGAFVSWRDEDLDEYIEEFRTEVLHATADGLQRKQQLRDDLLDIVDELLVELQTTEPAPENLRSLGQQLGEIIDAMPASDYQLETSEFTILPGVAYFLPGGTNSIAFVGPFDHGKPYSITIRRNGRRVIMSVGSVRTFRQGAQICKLTLNEVGDSPASATFTYHCPPNNNGQY